VRTERCAGNNLRLIGCLPVAREQSRVEPLQVRPEAGPQKPPGELERFLDVPALTALVDELMLEVVSEGEVTAVSLGERCLANDRDELA
jgi:hypothetical protein